MSHPHLTNFGIPGIGIVPYGIHMCHFYPTGQEMIDGLKPYFLAGLSNNERCIWVVSSPSPVDELRTEIAKSPELEQGITSGQLNISDPIAWYGDSSTLKAEEVIQRWVDEEAAALADGFQGLRIAADTGFIASGHWRRLMDYEEKLHARLKHHRIVTYCGYDREQCRPVDMLEVVRHHDGALDRLDKHWQVFLQPAKSDEASGQAGNGLR